MLPPATDANNDNIPAMTGSKIFVTLIFVLLGAIFLASTALIVHEFNDRNLPALLMMHGHLFLFFPTLGLLALAAFRLPAIVFTHLYWNHISYGKLRFLFGTLVVAAATAWVSWSLTFSSPHSIWELNPRTIAADRPEPDTCTSNSGPCRRASISQALDAVRTAASNRVGLSDFARICRLDPYLEIPETFQKSRYCFPALGKLTGETCCQAQERFATSLDRAWAQPDNRSLSQQFDLIALPAKTFFVIVVVVIGILLSVWRHTLDRFYAPLAARIERSLMIGALAMLPWPVMDYAYLQATQALTGRWSTLPDPRLSLIIIPWVLLILLYFLHRMSRKIERLGQLAGAVASVIAVLRYEELNDWSVRLLGVGAPIWTIGVLVFLSVLGYVVLRVGPNGLRPRPLPDKGQRTGG